MVVEKLRLGGHEQSEKTGGDKVIHSGIYDMDFKNNLYIYYNNIHRLKPPSPPISTLH